METLITDLEKPIGEKLIDADNMSNKNYYENIYFNCVEHLKFAIYLETVKNSQIS